MTTANGRLITLLMCF